jgi:TrmH family RNA methyltransferase
MGAIFSAKLAHVSDLSELPGERIALAAEAEEQLRGPFEHAAPRGAGEKDEAPGARAGGVTLLIGAEREGLPDTVIAACDRAARIPIASDSLNAAMAATVALYEMTRRPDRCPARPNDTVPAS